MFEQREFRTYRGVKRKDLYRESCMFWTGRGFYVAQISPYYIHGTSYYSRIGLKREFDLYVTRSGDDTNLDLTFRARITDEGLLVGAVAAVVFLPVAVVGGAISYHEWEKDARDTIIAFWAHMDDEAGRPGMVVAPTAPPPPTPPQPPPSSQAAAGEPCDECGALLLPDWKACPYCGSRL
jgi:hypothetical protein